MTDRNCLWRCFLDPGRSRIAASVLIALVAVLFMLGPAWADIRPEHSGTWFNVNQPGHGLSIQVLDDERTVAFWYAYTPEGHPMFLVINGVSDHHTVTGTAYYHEGMVWGEFDPDTVESEAWGEVTIEFLGCHRALLTWSSGAEGYGHGQIELERLSFVAWLECDEVAPELTGEWLARFEDVDSGPYETTIDADGYFEFYDALACRWEGHLHVQSLEEGRLTARFGAPTCSFVVPMLFAYGTYYKNGVSFCTSGGSCIHYDQAIGLMSEYFERDTINLTFLRQFP